MNSNKIKYRSGYKYQLAEDFTYDTGIKIPKEIDTEYIKMNILGEMIIKEGYASDGASGPTIDTEAVMKGAWVHDAGYQLMRGGYLRADFYRPLFDKLLEHMINESSAKIAKEDFNYVTKTIYLAWMKTRARYFYFFVSKFAEPFTDKKHGNPTIEAR